MAPIPGIFYPKLHAYNIWGTHQGAGKSIAAMVMTLSIATKGRGPGGSFYNIAYSKPISVGPAHENNKITATLLKWREGAALPKWYDSKIIQHTQVGEVDTDFGKGRTTGTDVKPDAEILSIMKDYADLRSDYLPSSRGLPPPGSFLFFETLAGVDARFPSRKPQAEVLRSLRLPGLLVADSRPGGFEKTIMAHDYLLSCGHDIHGALVFKDSEENHINITKYFDEHNVYCAILNQPPEKDENDHPKSNRMMMDYYKSMGRANNVAVLIKNLRERHAVRVKCRANGEETPGEAALSALAEDSSLNGERAAKLKALEDAREGKPQPNNGSKHRDTSQDSEFVRNSSAGGYKNSEDDSQHQSRTMGSKGGRYGDRITSQPRSSAPRSGAGGYGGRTASRPRHSAPRAGGQGSASFRT